MWQGEVEKGEGVDNHDYEGKKMKKRYWVVAWERVSHHYRIFEDPAEAGEMVMDLKTANEVGFENRDVRVAEAETNLRGGP